MVICVRARWCVLTAPASLPAIVCRVSPHSLCWKPSNDSGHITLALRGELVNQHLQDEGDAKDEEGATAPSSDEHGDRAELSELMRDRRRINGLRVYLAIGRRAGELVVNVYSPSKEAEVELQLPLQRLMYVVPGYLLEESHEQDMVHYLADWCVPFCVVLCRAVQGGVCAWWCGGCRAGRMPGGGSMLC